MVNRFKCDSDEVRASQTLIAGTLPSPEVQSSPHHTHIDTLSSEPSIDPDPHPSSAPDPSSAPLRARVEAFSANGRRAVRLDLSDGTIDTSSIRERLRSVSDRRLMDLTALLQKVLDAIDDELADRPTSGIARALRFLQNIEWDARDRTEARTLFESSRGPASVFSDDTVECWLDRHWPEVKESEHVSGDGTSADPQELGADIRRLQAEVDSLRAMVYDIVKALVGQGT